MRDVNRELVKLHLEERGYLVSFGVICTTDCIPSGEQKSRRDMEIDVVAVRLANGKTQAAMLGCVKGYWMVGNHLTPSQIHKLEDEKMILTRAFSAARMNYIRSRFGLDDVPIEKVLFYSQRSPQKHEEAERILASSGVRVVYLEDIVAEVLPRLKREPYLAESETLQTLRALRGTRLFAKAAPAKPQPSEKVKKATAAKSARKAESYQQLDLIKGLR